MSQVFGGPSRENGDRAASAQRVKKDMSRAVARYTAQVNGLQCIVPSGTGPSSAITEQSSCAIIYGLATHYSSITISRITAFSNTHSLTIT